MFQLATYLHTPDESVVIDPSPAVEEAVVAAADVCDWVPSPDVIDRLIQRGD